MNLIFALLQAIIGLSVGLVTLVFRLVLTVLAVMVAVYKHRNPWLWGMAVLIFPWTVLILFLLPKHYPSIPSHLKQEEAFRGKNPVIASIMALAAIVAKSDGAITRQEIDLLKKFISRQFGITGTELNAYASSFDYGKSHPEEYQIFTQIIRDFYNRRDVMISIAYLLVAIAMQDGEVSSKEDIQIRKIILELGVSEYEYKSIKNSFTYQESYSYYQGNRGYNQGSHQGYDFGQNKENLLKKYSEVLGVSEEAPMAEVKKAYRKLVKEYHPDKLAAESMPGDYVKFANEKIRQINEAYEYLKNVKAN
ncbi:hypothetical protein CS063_01890 [Sporanaerobium hydrogeniformans]|uniref:Uncharacterized protein n=1 Tax=Sporanaerobium hydrogeniformans TaxID=3072179 RepID=A0AC61DI01_9FIRM|nr:TerB family tellurite resistance protein [Sporanaerobium hydrogeniformans]PHV72251.1 hypothetical protein CS063_01890 [Sporanaerobium hydrogeniformans]